MTEQQRITHLRKLHRIPMVETVQEASSDASSLTTNDVSESVEDPPNNQCTKYRV